MSKHPPLIFIPAAGLGTRIGSGTERLPKPIISIGALPLIARIMQMYPSAQRFHLALGYESEYVQQVAFKFANIFNKSITFSYTNSWKDGAKGLSDTIKDSEMYLQEPFIFHTSDTILKSVDPNLIENCLQNTVFFGNPLSPGSYRTITKAAWHRKYFKTNEPNAYIGIAAVPDYETFWKKFNTSSYRGFEDGETLGLIPHLTNCVSVPKNSWLDAGDIQGIEIARNHFLSQDVVLERANEAIWNYDNEMFKFHTSPEFIVNRIHRSKALSPFTPVAKIVSKNMYSYPRVEGQTLSKGNTHDFQNFLPWINAFWFGVPERKPSNSEVTKYFDFYKKKTYERVQSFIDANPYQVSSINDMSVRPILDLLADLNWKSIALPRLTRAHGDLHPDNILINRRNGTFHLLDWRQDIAGYVTEYGDLYYDLAKLLHGLQVDHQLVNDKKYQVFIKQEIATCHIPQTSVKRENSEIFEQYLSQLDIDRRKLAIHNALIFLNIATLHDAEYSKFLFVYGHQMLHKTLLINHS